MSFTTGFMTELLEFADAHTYTKATFDADDFLNIGFERSDRFLSYLENLAILNYISADDSKYPAGINRWLDGDITLSILPLRLTESGRSFLRTRAKEAKSTLTMEKISDAKKEFEHSYKKVIQADANGFQPALRDWARSLTSDSTLAGILREVRYRTEFDVQSCCDKALAVGTLPQGGKQDEDVLLAYFMVKKVLDGDEHQRKFSDTWILSAKLNFGAVGDYTDDLQKLVVDFKNKYVTFLSRFILDQLTILAQTIPVETELSTEKKPMSPEEKNKFAHKLQHLRKFFRKYDERYPPDSEGLHFIYDEVDYDLIQTRIDEQAIRKELKKLSHLLSNYLDRFKPQYELASRLAIQESYDFMKREEPLFEEVQPPQCIVVILDDIIEPILFELEDLPSEESQNTQAIAKPFQHVKQGNTMPNYTKKLQVFISSTYMDLQEERKAAIHAILLTKNIPTGMENFSSRDRKQMDIIKTEIENADIFMLILGGRYGSVPKDSEKSYIHQEYEYAKSQNKPIFTLRLSEKYLDEKIKTGSSSSQVFEQKNTAQHQEFKSELTENTLCNTCEGLKDIDLEVFKSLNSIKEEHGDELKGWIKGDILDDHNELQQKYAALEKEVSLLRGAQN
jgi:hypothetical protein